MLPRAILLAGGKSSRFGSNKAVANFGGETLAAYCITSLLEVFSKVTVVAKKPVELGLRPGERVRFVYDDAPEHAAMIGLLGGLKHSDRTINYVTACDMPGIVPELIETLYTLARGMDCALRCDENCRLQPLGGFYSKSALYKIQSFVAAGNLRMSSLLGDLTVAKLPFTAISTLDPNFRSFQNVNTCEDMSQVIGYTTSLISQERNICDDNQM